MSVRIEVLSRSDWGADPSLPALGWQIPVEQIVGLVVHHTVMVLHDTDHDGYVAGDLDDIAAYMRRLQVARPDLGLDVPYSFVVFEGESSRDAVVAIGRGQYRTGAHTAGFNSNRWGVALAGDYTWIAPTLGMLEGVRLVGRWLADPAGARETLGHRDTVQTACPGAMAYPLLELVQPPFTSTEPPPPPNEVDMPEYVVRYAGDEYAPYIAVYPNGTTRHIGAGEWGALQERASIPVFTETDHDAHRRLVRLSGSRWPTPETE